MEIYIAESVLVRALELDQLLLTKVSVRKLKSMNDFELVRREEYSNNFTTKFLCYFDFQYNF